MLGNWQLASDASRFGGGSEGMTCILLIFGSSLDYVCLVVSCNTNIHIWTWNWKHQKEFQSEFERSKESAIAVQFYVDVILKLRLSYPKCPHPYRLHGLDPSIFRPFDLSTLRLTDVISAARWFMSVQRCNGPTEVAEPIPGPQSVIAGAKRARRSGLCGARYGARAGQI